MRIVLALVTGVLAAIVYGAVRWKVGTRELRARLEASRVPIGPRVVDFGELERLPAPVQRYFRAVLNEGQPEGLIETVRAEARGRTVGGQIVPTPWHGRFWSYEERDGMRVPLEGEVAWLLPEGPKPYWRGRITELVYEPAR